MGDPTTDTATTRQARTPQLAREAMLTALACTCLLGAAICAISGMSSDLALAMMIVFLLMAWTLIHDLTGMSLPAMVLRPFVIVSTAMWSVFGRKGNGSKSKEGSA